jgi:hypothetical protein
VNVRPFLPAVLFAAAIAGLAWLAWPGERLVPLVEVVPGPRPPVQGDPRTRPIALRGLLERFHTKGNALREERNEIAERHKAAVAAWRAGTMALRDVENLEQLLWVARFKVGEIDAKELHTRLAELFDREAQRLALLADQGMAGEDDVRLARLFTARERRLAGLPIDDPQGRDYAALRAGYLADFKRRSELLLESGFGTREQFELEWASLQRDFPEP